MFMVITLKPCFGLEFGVFLGNPPTRARAVKPRGCPGAVSKREGVDLVATNGSCGSGPQRAVCHRRVFG